MTDKNQFDFNEIMKQLKSGSYVEQMLELYEESPADLDFLKSILSSQQGVYDFFAQGASSSLLDTKEIYKNQTRILKQTMDDAMNMHKCLNGFKHNEKALKNAKVLKQALEIVMEDHANIVSGIEKHMNDLYITLEPRMQKNIETLKTAISKMDI